MTPEQQRIAIAEACGWYDLVKQDVSLFGKHEPESQKTFELDVPDYLNDLNAMHEAEKVLTTEQYADEFIYHLGCVFVDNDLYVIAKAVHATAARRAEAFLRALNLWKD